MRRGETFHFGVRISMSPAITEKHQAEHVELHKAGRVGLCLEGSELGLIRLFL